MFLAVKKFGFEVPSISWIKLLYSRPIAAVITNGQRTEQISLGIGTHQGCNLSPLLFALTIKPLAIALGQSNDFLGIK